MIRTLKIILCILFYIIIQQRIINIKSIQRFKKQLIFILSLYVHIYILTFLKLRR